jgi:hypothetical protein
LAKPIEELTVRGITILFCGWMKAAAAAHCAAVAVQADGRMLPFESVKVVLMTRLIPGKLRLTSSKLAKKKSLSFLTGPPRLPPA